MRRQINADELQYLYSRIGSAIWHLQHVENALASFIIIKGIAKAPNSLDAQSALSYEQQFNKLTLGQLLGKAHDLEVLEAQLLARMRKFNDERKWLVHNSVRESGKELYHSQGRDNVLTRMQNFEREAISLHKHLGELIVDYVEKKGISRNLIERAARQQIRNLKGEI